LSAGAAIDGLEGTAGGTAVELTAGSVL
jgi:hypothetical protein